MRRKTYEEHEFQMEFTLSDLSDSGLEKIDFELQDKLDMTLNELDTTEDPILGLVFSITRNGNIRVQYFDPDEEEYREEDEEEDEEELDLDLDLDDEMDEIQEEDDEWVSDEDDEWDGILTVDLTWEDITDETKETIREEMQKEFGKSDYRFDEDIVIGQARLDVTEELI